MISAPVDLVTLVVTMATVTVVVYCRPQQSGGGKHFFSSYILCQKYNTHRRSWRDKLTTGALTAKQRCRITEHRVCVCVCKYKF